MNKQILEAKLESLQNRRLLNNDYIEERIIKAQVELVETLLEALE